MGSSNDGGGEELEVVHGFGCSPVRSWYRDGEGVEREEEKETGRRKGRGDGVLVRLRRRRARGQASWIRRHGSSSPDPDRIEEATGDGWSYGLREARGIRWISIRRSQMVDGGLIWWLRDWLAGDREVASGWWWRKMRRGLVDG
jgi:hypothetical protein